MDEYTPPTIAELQQRADEHMHTAYMADDAGDWNAARDSYRAAYAMLFAAFQELRVQTTKIPEAR